jgi:hypothetical protein
MITPRYVSLLFHAGFSVLSPVVGCCHLHYGRSRLHHHFLHRSGLSLLHSPNLMVSCRKHVFWHGRPTMPTVLLGFFVFQIILLACFAIITSTTARTSRENYRVRHRACYSIYTIFACIFPPTGYLAQFMDAQNLRELREELPRVSRSKRRLRSRICLARVMIPIMNDPCQWVSRFASTIHCLN